MKGTFKAVAIMLLVAACGGDKSITAPESPNAHPLPPGVLAIGTDPTTGASIETNADDYVPGEVVHVVGKNWTPGETVNLRMTENPDTHADVDTNVVADASGEFSIHYYEVQEHDVGVTFTLTASGGTSHSVAVATFYDANGDVKAKTNSNAVTVTVSWRRWTGNNSCSGLPTTTGTTPNVSNANTNIIVDVPAGQSIELSVPTTASGKTFVSWDNTVFTNTFCFAMPNGNSVWQAIYTALPTANPGGPYTGNEGSAIALTGSGTDTDGTISSYAWTYQVVTADAGASCSFSSASVQSPTITCNDNGAYTVKLEVTDSDGGKGSATANLTVSNVAPTATFNAPTPQVSGANFTISLTSPADVSTNDVAAGFTYAFDCGAGYNAFSATASRSCTAGGAGTQNVKGKIRDKNNGEREYTAPITVTANNAAPTANANGPYSGNEGSAIQLSSSGSADTDGTINVYAWSYTKVTGHAGASCGFSNAAVANPTITCNDNGTFTVSLTVTDDDGATSTPSTANLTVSNVNPTASISAASPQNFGASFNVSLNGGSDVSMNDLTVGFTYAFDCGDGNGYNAFGASNSRSCTASVPNSQTVKGKIRDKDNGENEYTSTVSVSNAAPTANAGGPYSGTEGSAVNLSAAGSTDTDGTIASYAWTYQVVSADVGASCSITNANTVSPSITCDDDGTFSVKVVVTDDDGASDDATATLTLTNANPTANAHGPYSGAEGSAIQLSGSGNDPGDNDDGALTYHWSVTFAGVIDPSGACSFSNANVQNPTLTCTDDSNAGTFSLSLTVSDDDGGTSVASTTTVSVTNANPVANAGGTKSGAEGSAIALSGSANDPGDNDDPGLTYLWSVDYTGIDNGGTCTITNPTSATTASVKCTDDGSFSVSLEATDDDGGSNKATVSLNVSNANPTADANGPYSGTEGSAIAVSGSGDDAGDNDVSGLTYLWSAITTGIDAGGTCTFANPNAASTTVTCTDDGNFSVKLKVMDDDGGYGSQTVALTVSNANPTADAHGPYSGNEGSAIQLAGSGDDPGDNDDGALTYAWSVNTTGIDAGGACTFSSNTAQNPTITCTDDSNGGNFVLSLVVSDDDGGTSVASTANLTVANVKPTANAGGPYTGNEGANVSLTGGKSDAGSNDTHTYAWTWAAQSGVDAGASCSYTTATLLSPTVKCTDDGVFKLTLVVTDDDGTASDGSDATLTLANVNPVVTLVSPTLMQLFNLLSGPVPATVTISDAGANDTHQCRVELVGDMNAYGSYAAASGANCTASVTAPQADVYLLTVRVKDDDNGEGTASTTIVVYDPSAGFVTGGGWINSPAGAYNPDPTLTGKATFGFVSKYKKGATVPEGNTEFQFHAGNLNFHSENYDYLIVNQNGTNAMFTGTGTINGTGNYTFQVWATDNGNSGDTFRIQIKQGTTTIYDNGTGQLEQAIAGGSIIVHAAKK